MASGDPPPPSNSSWGLSLNRDYIDLTTFGEVNKEYLVSQRGDPPTYTLKKTLRKHGAIYLGHARHGFQYGEAYAMYADDPVAMAIIERMERLEKGETP